MEETIEQHRALTPRTDKIYEYCRTCALVNYDEEKLKSPVEASARLISTYGNNKMQEYCI